MIIRWLRTSSSLPLEFTEQNANRWFLPRFIRISSSQVRISHSPLANYLFPLVYYLLSLSPYWLPPCLTASTIDLQGYFEQPKRDSLGMVYSAFPITRVPTAVTNGIRITASPLYIPESSGHLLFQLPALPLRFSLLGKVLTGPESRQSTHLWAYEITISMDKDESPSRSCKLTRYSLVCINSFTLRTLAYFRIVRP